MGKGINNADSRKNIERADYYSRQLKAMLQALGETASGIPADELECMEAIVRNMREDVFGLSEKTVEYAARLVAAEREVEGKRLISECTNNFFHIVFAALALRWLAIDKYNVWHHPEDVSAKIEDKAEAFELAATDFSIGPDEIEQQTENIIHAAFSAHLLGEDVIDYWIEGASSKVEERLESMRKEYCEIICRDDFAEYDESATDMMFELLLWRYVLRNVDYMIRTGEARNMAALLIERIEEAVVTKGFEKKGLLKDESEAFLSAVVMREALHSILGSMGESDAFCVKRLIDSLDIAIVNGDAEELRGTAERMEPAIESLMGLYASSEFIGFSEYLDDALLGVLQGWQNDLRYAACADDAASLFEKNFRFMRLFESIVSYEALCRTAGYLSVSDDNDGSSFDLSRVREAILVGDAASCDERTHEAFILLNGSLHLEVLRHLMSMQDDIGFFSVYKAKLIGHFAKLEVALKTSNAEKVEMIIDAIDPSLTGGFASEQAVKSSNLFGVRESEDDVDGNKDGKSKTAFETVIEMTAMKREACRKVEVINKARVAFEEKSAALNAAIENDPDYALELAIRLGVALSKASLTGDNIANVAHEVLGLKEEWDVIYEELDWESFVPGAGRTLLEGNPLGENRW